MCVCVCVRARLHACQSRLRCNFTLSGTNTLTSSQETITFWNSEHDSAKYRVLPTPFLTLLAALSGLPHITRVMVGNRCIEKPYCAYEQSYDRLASLCSWIHMTGKPHCADEVIRQASLIVQMNNHMTCLVNWNKTSCVPLHAPCFPDNRYEQYAYLVCLWNWHVER